MSSGLLGISTQSVGVGPGMSMFCSMLVDSNSHIFLCRRWNIHACVRHICHGHAPCFYTSICSRVSIVDYRGAIKLDCWVKPTLPVSDYRTVTTGIEAHHLTSGSYFSESLLLRIKKRIDSQKPNKKRTINSEAAVSFDDVQRHVANLIANKILVGYCLWNDLSGSSLIPTCCSMCCKPFSLFSPLLQS